MKNLYALVVGIDAYQPPVPALSGCVNDASMVADYLEKNVDRSQLNLHLVKLFNADAKRQNIIDAFSKHLGQAEAGDVAFFFFAGHGSREAAHEFFFKIEPDKMLETIVCFDSRRNGVNDLADKELRHLIYQLAGQNPATAPHVIIVQDNCHSGGASRDAEGARPEEGLIPRFSPNDPQPRTWDKFLFANAIPLTREAETKKMSDLFPEGLHIQLAACANDEYAWETTHTRPDGSSFKGGVFTRRFLEALQQSKGDISYHDLVSKIRGKVTGSTAKAQTPNVYTSGNPNDVFRTFLYGNMDSGSTSCNVQYSPTLGWHIDVGAFHFVPSNPAASPTYVKVREDKRSTKVYNAVVTAVEAGRSRIVFQGEAPPQELYCIGEIENLWRPKLKVFFTIEVASYGFFEKLSSSANPDIANLFADVQRVQSEAEAQYVVSISEGAFIINRPGNPRPLVIPVGPLSEPSALSVMQQLAHIGRWEATRQLFNPATRLRPLPPVLIEFFRYEGMNPNPVNVPLQGGAVEFSLDNPTVEIRLTNISNQTLFAGALQLDSTFGIASNCVAGFVEKLDPQQSVYLTFGSSNPQLVLGMPSYITEYNWEHYEFMIKVMISTSMFHLATLDLSELPPPQKIKMVGPLAPGTRAFSAATPPQDMPDWACYNATVRVRNPYFRN